MTHYSLLVVDQQTNLRLPSAKNRLEALSHFGKELNRKLTLNGDGPAPFLLDEWEQGPHWTNHQIPVYAE